MKQKILRDSVLAGLGLLITGIIIFYFKKEMQNIEHVIFYIILIIIGIIGAGWRAWYFHKDDYDKNKEEAFNNLIKSMKSNRKQ
jgi:hypothetical protein